MTTTTKTSTIKDVANSGNLNELAEVAQKVGLGTMLDTVKLTKTGLTSAIAHDITDAAHGSNPAASIVGALRVTAGAAAAGLRQIGDAGATPSATVATLSDDGKTLTFEAAVTGFVMVYQPMAAVSPGTKFA
jgi:hypothetical protein